jgi:hypothetical protein
MDALCAAGIPYMLVGSLASNFYGIPRATQDADFVVHLENKNLAQFCQSLAPPFHFDPQSSFEMVTGTTRYVLELVDSPFYVEFFLLSEDSHDQQRFQRRREVQILGRGTFIPTAEDVVITKLRWSHHGRRAKDLDDARNVIALQGQRMDWNYVNSWCDRHETRGLLDEIRRRLPPG